MQDEEVFRCKSGFEHGYRHVDQEGPRRIDDVPSLMQDEEVCCKSGFQHGYRHVDQEGARCIDDGLPMMQDEAVFGCGLSVLFLCPSLFARCQQTIRCIANHHHDDAAQ